MENRSRATDPETEKRKPKSDSLSRRSTIRRIHEILQFLAGLEEGNFLWRHFHLGPGLGIPPHPPAPLAGAKAAEAANFDLVARLQGLDDALENGLDDGLRLLPGELGYAQNLFNEVGFRQCRLLGHRPLASSH